MSTHHTITHYRPPMLQCAVVRTQHLPSAGPCARMCAMICRHGMCARAPSSARAAWHAARLVDCFVLISRSRSRPRIFAPLSFFSLLASPIGVLGSRFSFLIGIVVGHSLIKHHLPAAESNRPATHEVLPVPGFFHYIRTCRRDLPEPLRRQRSTKSILSLFGTMP